MNNQIISFRELANNAVHITEFCDLPAHNHKSNWLELYAVDYRGRHISIVQDLDFFDVQIDHDPTTTKRGLTWAGLEDYVEAVTANRCQIDL